MTAQFTFPSGRVVAFMDIGANSMRLLLERINPNLSYTSQSKHAYLVVGKSVRERSVLQLGRACGFDEPHARTVGRLALTLYDSARESELHNYGDAERELLEYAALDKRSRRLVGLFAVLLRIAESLDRSHTGVVHNASLRALDKKNVVLEIFASQDCQLEIWGALNHKKAFKKTFGRRLQLEVAIDELAVQSDELTPARKEG